LVYALDVSCSFSKTFAVQNDKIADLNLVTKQHIYIYIYIYVKKNGVYTCC